MYWAESALDWDVMWYDAILHVIVWLSVLVGGGGVAPTVGAINFHVPLVSVQD